MEGGRDGSREGAEEGERGGGRERGREREGGRSVEGRGRQEGGVGDGGLKRESVREERESVREEIDERSRNVYILQPNAINVKIFVVKNKYKQKHSYKKLKTRNNIIKIKIINNFY